jgi:hypothetical protein
MLPELILIVANLGMLVLCLYMTYLDHELALYFEERRSELNRVALQSMPSGIIV